MDPVSDLVYPALELVPQACVPAPKSFPHFALLTQKLSYILAEDAVRHVALFDDLVTHLG